MARPIKKTPEQWKTEILSAAQKLFISKGYEETSISDIMDTVGGAKGMFYRCFQSKEEIMYALGNQMFFEDNPFETVKGRDDLNGLQKIRLLLTLNQSDAERNQINMQAVPILKDPHILAAAVAENRRVLTPLWLELLEEGNIVWKFYIETGTVHVCTGSDWFGSHICRDIVCCYNPDHSFVTAWRHLGGQGRQTEYYGGVRRIDWRIRFMCGAIPVGKQCHCCNQYVAYYSFYFGCV